MKKAELMSYVGKIVEITFTDDTTYHGTLEYTKEKMSTSRNWFVIGDICFKAKHVRNFRASDEQHENI